MDLQKTKTRQIPFWDTWNKKVANQMHVLNIKTFVLPVITTYSGRQTEINLTMDQPGAYLITDK